MSAACQKSEWPRFRTTTPLLRLEMSRMAPKKTSKDSRAPLARPPAAPVKMAPPLNPTLNDLPENTRRKVVSILNQELADIIDLRAQTKQAHWNVKGSNFIGLHKLFDSVAKKLDEYTDMIAERGVELGGVAMGTIRLSAAHSRLKEYPLEIQASSDHVKALSRSLSQFGASIRAGIDTTEDLGDMDTSDLFTEISRALDKYLWMIEAHNLGR